MEGIRIPNQQSKVDLNFAADEDWACADRETQKEWTVFVYVKEDFYS